MNNPTEEWIDLDEVPELATEHWYDEYHQDVLFRTMKNYKATLSNGEVIYIPAGYVTDFCTAPDKWYLKPLVRAIIGQIGRHNKATLIHDYLYNTQYSITDKEHWKIDRAFADHEMKYRSAKDKVTKAAQWIMNAGVRIAGRKWWLE